MRAGSLLLLGLARATRVGTLELHLPDGDARTFRGGAPGPAAVLEVRNPRVGWRLLLGGANGFAEAYLAGEFDSPDLAALLRFGARNQEHWSARRPGGHHRLARLWQRLHRPRRHRAVESMVDHYDLGNDFYRAWLDPSMTYSSARFVADDLTLAEAQQAKYRSLASAIDLRPGQRVLEIGCGWGGFAVWAAREFGCSLTGVTVSTEQAELARKRVAHAGVGHLVDIRLEDFREETGTFDRVVSIEMIESIDEPQWTDLFRVMRARLAPGGVAGIQAITMRDDLWEAYRRRRDFIQRYVFPGGQLPSVERMRRLASAAGLEVSGYEAFGGDYARTLAEWHRRFDAAWPSLAGGKLDERFRRMWKYYLAYCQAGFEIGRIDVGQLILRRR